MPVWKALCAQAVGAFLATLAFWICLNLILPSLPVSLLQQLGFIVTTDSNVALSVPQSAAITILQQAGLGISADDYLGRLTTFYGTVLQIALGAFVLFGFISFVAIRWQSSIAAQELVENKVDNMFTSDFFEFRMRRYADEAFDVESYEDLFANIEDIQELSDRMTILERHIAESSSETEPTEVDVMETEPTTLNREL